MKVYFILDEKSNAVKIGKANNTESRLSDLQTGNPNPLRLIHEIDCGTEEQSFVFERQLHNKYKDLRLTGEWFTYDETIFQELFEQSIDFERKNKREPITANTLFGTETLFSIEDFPTCHFYPHLVAQVMSKYEDSVRRSNPFRTMAYPTNGKQMLLPWSVETDRVFISHRKHEENLKMKKFLKAIEDKQNSTANTLVGFI